MTGFTVRDIVVGDKDFVGLEIIEIYGKVSERYAVYRNSRHVMIQFSDDDNEGINQRSSLTPLLALRGEISAIIAKLQGDRSPYQQAKADEYSSRLGTALVVALQGDVLLASSELEKIGADLVEDRASDTRTWHLLWAALATVITIIVASLLASSWFMNAFSGMAREWPEYWHAASIGAIGALFSIALQLRARQVRVDTQPWDNLSDAVLRVLVGATSAVILTALFKGNIVDIRLSHQAIGTSSAGLLILAFAAGFTERLVAEFLSTIGLAAREQAPRATPATVKVDDERALATGRTGTELVSTQYAGLAPRHYSSGPAPILIGDGFPSEIAELAPDDDQAEYQGEMTNALSGELRPVG